jgi:tyrosinase
MGVRRNITALTAAQRAAFVKAILTLKARGTYDTYVKLHADRINTDVDGGVRIGHRSPSFFPWHRKFLLSFEADLKTVDPSVDLPYWDWTTARSLTAAPWTADLMGGNGRTGDLMVTTGPFAYSTGKWPVTVAPDGRPYLWRQMATPGWTLPTSTDVGQVQAMGTYDTAPYDGTSNPGASMRNAAEGCLGTLNLHNRVHPWVGGSMATAGAPNDPVFWLHHCQLDRLFSQWQTRWPNSPYLPQAGVPGMLPGWNQPMAPWSTTPQQVWSHSQWYTYA